MFQGCLFRLNIFYIVVFVFCKDFLLFMYRPLYANVKLTKQENGKVVPIENVAVRTSTTTNAPVSHHNTNTNTNSGSPSATTASKIDLLTQGRSLIPTQRQQPQKCFLTSNTTKRYFVWNIIWYYVILTCILLYFL